MIAENSFFNYLHLINELVYKPCGFELTNLIPNKESVEYGACSFIIQANKIEYRVSKITPTKTGQFVSIWKRNSNGITEPFNVLDDLDFVIITCKSGDNFGQFIFPKAVLVKKGIITQNSNEGKRGIRVYPPWDKANSKQAEATQNWQLNYFLVIKNNNLTDLELAKKLFAKK